MTKYRIHQKYYIFWKEPKLYIILERTHYLSSFVIDIFSITIRISTWAAILSGNDITSAPFYKNISFTKLHVCISYTSHPTYLSIIIHCLSIGTTYEQNAQVAKAEFNNRQEEDCWSNYHLVRHHQVICLQIGQWCDLVIVLGSRLTAFI